MDDDDVMRPRSPWHGLTGSQILELSEAAENPDRLRLPEPDRWESVAVEYALAAVRSLSSNDLRGALRSSALATTALDLAERSTHRLGERKPIVHQDEPTTYRTEPAARPLPAHRPHRIRPARRP